MSGRRFASGGDERPRRHSPEKRPRVSGGGPRFLESAERIRAVVLFLAHDGVKQGRLWEEWKRDAPEFAFVVHTGGRSVYDDEFVAAYGVKELTQETAWGEMSLVLAYQEGLCYALRMYPKAEIFHFLSGTDIPVRSASHILKSETETRFASNVGPRGAVTKLSVTGLLEGREIDPVSFVTHSANHVLSRADAEVISRADLSAFSVWGSETGCTPDEFVPGTVLRAFHSADMYAWTRKHITWAPYVSADMIEDEKNKNHRHASMYTTVDDPIQTGRTLRSAILDLRPSASFLRKVERTADLFAEPRALEWMQSQDERDDAAFLLDVMGAFESSQRPAVVITVEEYRSAVQCLRKADWQRVRIVARNGAGEACDALEMNETDLRNSLFSLRIAWEGEVPGFPGAERTPGGATVPLWTAAIMPFMHKKPLRALRKLVGPVNTSEYRERGKAPAIHGAVNGAGCAVQ